MKNIVIFVCLSINISLFGQNESKKNFPISIAYYGPYLIQPGIKVGTSFNVKEVQNEEKKGASAKSKYLFISPQLGFFSRINNHTSFVLNVDLGYKILKKKNNRYSAYSIGLGYLTSSQILSSSVDLSNGDIGDKDREQRHYFLPTINYEFGKAFNKKMGWYTKLSFGRKISSKLEDAAFFAIELGGRYIVH